MYEKEAIRVAEATSNKSAPSLTPCFVLAPAGIVFEGSDPMQESPTGASTDAGNASHAVPTAHPVYAIEATARNHTREFCEATGSDAAQAPTLCVAQALALTAMDVLRDSELLRKVTEEFKALRAAETSREG